MTLATGTRLGPYEILAPIGAGGMGEVYRALDRRLDRTVAIKVLSAHLSVSEQSRQRFEREAKTISQQRRLFQRPLQIGILARRPEVEDLRALPFLGTFRRAQGTQTSTREGND